jgi:peptide deformylase
MKDKKASLSIVPISDIPLAEDVPTDNLLAIFRLTTQMEQLCTQQKGIGLSAVQVGIPWKLFIVLRETEYEYYINCDYTGIGKLETSIEGCLSLRDKQNNLRRFEVPRYASVSIKGKQLKIVGSSLVLEDVNRVEHGLHAVVFQHEIDHNFQRERMIDIIGKEIELLA